MTVIHRAAKEAMRRELTNILLERDCQQAVDMLNGQLASARLRSEIMYKIFPYGQLTYMAGEGLTSSAFLPLFGGLLQAQGRYPRETRISFSCKVSMESNGKGVFIDGIPLPFETGEIDFGEPGTNGQHSFYQLIHRGRVIPCDFIGVVKSQQPVYLKGEIPDALAYGKTPEQLLRENVPNHLIPHRTFSGNRPSLSLLLPSLNAYNVGQLLAVYEHRIAVEGFICGGSTLSTNGSLATQVRKQLNLSRTQRKPVQEFNHSTTTLLTKYLEDPESSGTCYTSALSNPSSNT
uniref:Glucose-6-phosphate isomerase n=1 Tax=Ananas comosus var. bracteatus TaxID=296719 RepID=A0A6V7PJK9_ANACO|nr:unnamed protein product [Ananas comosus var. bracteatus]